MEDQSSWKGHTFTLMIFGGIVVLSAIFFILGMLVGRMQAPKLATVATADAAGKNTANEPHREEPSQLRLPDRTDSNDLALSEPAIAKPDRPSPRLAPKVEDSPPAASLISLQVAALKKQTEAEKQLADLKKKGFGRAFILSPASSDSNPLYRVQVAVSDSVEAESVKQKLEAAGYKPIIKK